MCIGQLNGCYFNTLQLTCVHFISSAAPAKKKQKAGRKTAEESIAHNLRLRDACRRVVSDSHHLRSPYQICKNEPGSLRNSVERVIKKDQALVEVMEAQNRRDPEMVQNALLAIDRLLPPSPAGELSTASPPKDDDDDDNNKDDDDAPSPVMTLPLSERDKARKPAVSIFEVAVLREAIAKLDWDASPRPNRSGSGTIEIVKERLPSEHVKASILDLCNNVMLTSNLGRESLKEVTMLCASLLMYDAGYEAARGYSRLHTTWRARMNHCYETGDYTRPLKSQMKGRSKKRATEETVTPDE